MEPNSILPPEMWTTIFENVKKEPQDWLNLLRSSPSSFGTLVGDQRQSVLFPKVFPFLYQYLNWDLKQLLPLRLVSRQWRATVDSSIEILDDRIRYTCQGHYFAFETVASIPAFLDKFDGSHPGINPFIGRAIQLGLSPLIEDNLVVAWNLATRLLTLFGHHVQRLSISAFNSTWVNPLRTCLLLTPNLAKLVLTVGNISLVDYEGVQYRPNHRHHPWPALPNLKSFLFTGYGEDGFMEEVQSAVTRNSNRETLTDVMVAGVPSHLRSVHFPNLTSAYVTLSPRRRLEDLLHMHTCSWPLSRLVISISASIPEPRLGLEQVLKAVQTFKDTLTDLHLRVKLLNNSSCCEEDSMFQVELPRLKRLTIECMAPLRPFLKLANLEDFHILHTLDYRRMLLQQSHQERVKCVKRVELLKTEMIGYDVFGVLPKLQGIRLTVDSCLQRQGNTWLYISDKYKDQERFIESRNHENVKLVKFA